MTNQFKENKKLIKQEPQGKELYDLRKKQKEEAKKKEQKTEAIPRKINKYLFYGIISIGVIGSFSWFIFSRPNLPPISIEGHVEESPLSHIVTEPIPEVIQRHMLEHADGEGKPGILIQYNCKKYFCEPDIIQKLTDLVKQYPDNVYLAPNNYDGKIILTKLGKRQILDSFDEQAIKNFINE